MKIKNEVLELFENHTVSIGKIPISVEETKQSSILNNTYFIKSDKHKHTECDYCDKKNFSWCLNCGIAVCKDHAYLCRLNFVLDVLCSECRRDLMKLTDE